MLTRLFFLLFSISSFLISLASPGPLLSFSLFSLFALVLSPPPSSLSIFCISSIYYGNFHFPLSFFLPIVWSSFCWKSLLYSSVFFLIQHYLCFSFHFLGMCRCLSFPLPLPPVSHFSVFVLFRAWLMSGPVYFLTMIHEWKP